MRNDAVIDKKAKRGRPKIDRNSNTINPLDLLNLKEFGQLQSKSMKVKESTWLILNDMKDNDDSIKTLDEVIVSLLAIASMAKY